jgi:hypothetical protein
MADCYKLMKKYTHFLDGDLQGAEKEKFEQHLGSCPECGRRLGQTREIVKNLSALSKYKTSPTFEIVLRSKLRSELNKRSTYSHFFLPEKWSQVTAYAAGIILLISTGIFIDRSLDKQTTQPIIFQPLSETTTVPMATRLPKNKKIKMKNYVMDQYPVAVLSDKTEPLYQPVRSPNAQTFVTGSVERTKMVPGNRPLIQPASAVVRF